MLQGAIQTAWTVALQHLIAHFQNNIDSRFIASKKEARV